MTASPKNIVLVGFMASGKSRIGAILAERLNYELCDVDAIIEKTAGLSIKDIFETKGERYFRELESLAIKGLLDKSRCVIVPGAGAPMFFDNACALKELGILFFLDANLPLILERLRRSQKRPLGTLKNSDDEQKLIELFQYRRPIYASLGHAVDVNHQDKSKICDEIWSRYNAAQILTDINQTVLAFDETKYPIFHHESAIKYINSIVDYLGLASHQKVIVTSENLHMALAKSIETITNSFPESVPVLTIKDGEDHKTMESVGHLHHQMFSLGLTRKSLVLALGGGNVGDIAGFAASMYLRGVPFIQIPTTLLAMVDASIGGKTGVDTHFGKNLIGSFYHPKAVVIDPNVLTSLPADEWACGMAEVIKHAIIADREFFFELLQKNLSPLTIIERALLVKVRIVSSDPFEKNIRAYLNLGHTFGHAIETISGYQIKHGMAVAIGLVLATKASKACGLLEEDFLPDLKLLLKKFDLPTELPKNISKKALVSAMRFDKKRDQCGLTLVLPKKVGEIALKSFVTPEEVESLID